VGGLYLALYRLSGGLRLAIERRRPVYCEETARCESSERLENLRAPER
jgi:hypothetical protein